MLITTNRAAEILRDAGLTRDRARRLLATGVAGSGLRTSGALLYDEERVWALGDRRFVTERAVAAACPHGLLVGRLGADSTVSVTDDPVDRRRAVSGPWRPKQGWRMLIRSRCRAGITIPFVATVSGYVVLGADVTGLRSDGAAASHLQLAEPGGWYDDVLRERRWPGGRGGPPLLMWGWRPMANTSAGGPPHRLSG